MVDDCGRNFIGGSMVGKIHAITYMQYTIVIPPGGAAYTNGYNVDVPQNNIHHYLLLCNINITNIFLCRVNGMYHNCRTISQFLPPFSAVRFFWSVCVLFQCVQSVLFCCSFQFCAHFVCLFLSCIFQPIASSISNFTRSNRKLHFTTPKNQRQKSSAVECLPIYHHIMHEQLSLKWLWQVIAVACVVNRQGDDMKYLAIRHDSLVAMQ